MANTSITFTWYHAGANTTDSYIHEMSDESMDRIIEAARLIFGTPNPETMTTDLVSKNKARKETCKESLRLWKDRARAQEITIAQSGVAANIAPIDSTEV